MPAVKATIVYVTKDGATVLNFRTERNSFRQNSGAAIIQIAQVAMLLKEVTPKVPKIPSFPPSTQR